MLIWSPRLFFQANTDKNFLSKMCYNVSSNLIKYVIGRMGLPASIEKEGRLGCMTDGKGPQVWTIQNISFLASRASVDLLETFWDLSGIFGAYRHSRCGLKYQKCPGLPDVHLSLSHHVQPPCSPTLPGIHMSTHFARYWQTAK